MAIDLKCNQLGNEGNPCRYKDEGRCDFIPLEWAKFCPHEHAFAKARAADIRVVYGELEKVVKAKVPSGFMLNEVVLEGIAYTYANDVKPIRQFHNNSGGGIDRSRRATLLARLIANHRPIHFVNPTTRIDTRPLTRVNDSLAMQAFFHFLNLRPDFFVKHKNWYVQQAVNDLKFSLLHRDLQVETVVSVARLLLYLGEISDLKAGKINPHLQEQAVPPD